MKPWMLVFGLLVAIPACGGDDPDDIEDQEQACEDGIDDDGDGAIDCEDPDCIDRQLCGVPDEICDDGTDDDGDGFVDCEDDDCTDSCNVGDFENCQNEIDDDGDGNIDCADLDCGSNTACTL